MRKNLQTQGSPNFQNDLADTIKAIQHKIEKKAAQYLKFLTCIARLSLVLNSIKAEFLGFGLYQAMLSFLEYECLRCDQGGSENSIYMSETSDDSDDSSKESDLFKDPTPQDNNRLLQTAELNQLLIAQVRERLLKLAGKSPFNLRDSMINHFTRIVITEQDEFVQLASGRRKASALNIPTFVHTFARYMGPIDRNGKRASLIHGYLEHMQSVRVSKITKVSQVSSKPIIREHGL